MKNVVLLILDALRYDHVTRENMPNLLSIADEGAFFTHAFSCNSSTKLSIPCILSSEKKYDSERNVAQIMRKNLYKTAIIHSNPLIKTFYPGFDTTIDIKSSPRLGKGWKKVVRKTLPSSVISGLKKMRTKIASDTRVVERLNLFVVVLSTTFEPISLIIVVREVFRCSRVTLLVPPLGLLRDTFWY